VCLFVCSLFFFGVGIHAVSPPYRTPIFWFPPSSIVPTCEPPSQFQFDVLFFQATRLSSLLSLRLFLRVSFFLPVPGRKLPYPFFLCDNHTILSLCSLLYTIRSFSLSFLTPKLDNHPFFPPPIFARFSGFSTFWHGAVYPHVPQ